MPAVRDILARKGTDVVHVSPATSVLDAARLMNTRSIGSVVVVEAGALIGIFTERDILRRVVAEQREPAKTPVQAVMSTSLVTCTPDMSVAECGAVMSGRRIRHLPVLEAGQLGGMVTTGDLLAFQIAEHESTIQHLNRYVYDVR